MAHECGIDLLTDAVLKFRWNFQVGVSWMEY